MFKIAGFPCFLKLFLCTLLALVHFSLLSSRSFFFSSFITFLEFMFHSFFQMLVIYVFTRGEKVDITQNLCVLWRFLLLRLQLR